MIEINLLKTYYTDASSNNVAFEKNILKEHIELLVLEYLFTTKYAPKLTFIGGTNLRLIKGIQRFSEDLDFDIKGLSLEEFIEMTDGIAKYLKAHGLPVEILDKENPNLSAYRRNIYFPGLLYDLKLTGHREERFLLKIEAQDQGVEYKPEMKYIQRNGFFFPVQTAPDSVLLSMKLSALLARAKGRDFYDVMFLMGLGITPDYDFLASKRHIANEVELKKALDDLSQRTNFKIKKNDFSHLIFDSTNAKKIELFPEWVNRTMSQ